MIRKNKKSQIYGLNAFLFALAIAIILLVAMLGTTKDFENRSRAGLYRVSGILAARGAEQIKHTIDQERRYAFDKALYMTGAYGGYLSYDDLLGDKNCAHPGCEGICSGAVCAGEVKCADTPFYEGSLFVPQGSCYCNVSGTITIVNAPADNYCYYKLDCGGMFLNSSFIPEKSIPYWKNYAKTCIPDYGTTITENVVEYASRPFSLAHRSITALISILSDTQAEMTYVLDVKKFTESEIETVWYPIGNSRLVITDDPFDPIVRYSFKPFVHSYPQTEFYDIYTEARLFVEGDSFSQYLFNESTGAIPSVLDKRYHVLRSTETEVNEIDAPDPESLVALVEFFSDTDNYPEHPDFSCASVLDTSLVSEHYSGTCGANMTKDADGQLTILSGNWIDCNTGVTADDDAAMKCIMWKIAQRMNIDLGLGSSDSQWKPTNPDGEISELGWNFDAQWVVVELEGTTTNSMEYNTSLPAEDECKDCIPATIASGFVYSKTRLKLSAAHYNCNSEEYIKFFGERWFNRIVPLVTFAEDIPENTYGFVAVDMYIRDTFTIQIPYVGTSYVLFNKTHTIASTNNVGITIHESLANNRVYFVITPYPEPVSLHDHGGYGTNVNAFMDNLGVVRSRLYPLVCPPTAAACIAVDVKHEDNCGGWPSYLSPSIGNIIPQETEYTFDCAPNCTCDGICDLNFENSTTCPTDCHCGAPPAGDGLCNLNYSVLYSSSIDDLEVVGFVENATGEIKTNENFVNCFADCYANVLAPENFNITQCSKSGTSYKLNFLFLWTVPLQESLPATTPYPTMYEMNFELFYSEQISPPNWKNIPFNQNVLDCRSIGGTNYECNINQVNMPLNLKPSTMPLFGIRASYQHTNGITYTSPIAQLWWADTKQHCPD